MNREAIYSALFDLASDPRAFVTMSRTLKHWADVKADRRPALFQAQGRETVLATEANGLPPKWLLEATLFIYVSTRGTDSPGEVLNPLLDTLTAKFDPSPIGMPQTLGGLVQWARIEGAIETSEGTLGTDEIAMIPIRMLVA